MKFCPSCRTHTHDVSYRPRNVAGMRVLCAACNVDANSSSTRAVEVKPREVEDRYTLLARKHGLA